MTDVTDPVDRLLDAALLHVPFDGWSPVTFRAAAADAGMTEAEAKVYAPRGAVDLAVEYHRRGDREMVERLNEADLTGHRFSERVATALKYRIDAMDNREAVRRASALFALPQHAPEGAKLVWETADHVWNALGDTSDDLNYYTKRATLSGVWASTVLYWLGDDTPDHGATKDFIDRRIENVMQFEKVKSRLRDNPLTRPLSNLQSALFSRVRRPDPNRYDDLPGKWTEPH